MVKERACSYDVLISMQARLSSSSAIADLCKFLHANKRSYLFLGSPQIVCTHARWVQIIQHKVSGTIGHKLLRIKCWSFSTGQ